MGRRVGKICLASRVIITSHAQFHAVTNTHIDTSSGLEFQYQSPPTPPSNIFCINWQQFRRGDEGKHFSNFEPGRVYDDDDDANVLERGIFFFRALG
jgi:hypothetical protein